MAFKITEDCTCCGTCVDECPQSAISEGDDLFTIDPAKCNECSDQDEQQCASVCPVEACVKG